MQQSRSGMKRGEFPFYKKNNYILYDLDSGRKFKVYCSLYLDKCNLGCYLDKKIFVKYLSVEIGIKYLYYIKLEITSSLKSILLKNIRMKIKLFIFSMFILIFHSYICYALTII